jgi:hypothetical protein
MAYSSAMETENHLVIAGDLRYFPLRTYFSGTTISP